MRKSFFLAAVCLLAVIASPLFADSPIATVNGKPISMGEFNRRVKSANVTGAGREVAVLDAMITGNLVEQIAAQLKVTPTAAQMKKKMAEIAKMGDVNQMLRMSGITMSDFRHTVFVEQSAMNIINKITKVTDQEVRREYDKNKITVFTRPESSNVAVIVCKSKAKAAKAYEQVKGGRDFGTVSKEMSDDDFVRSNSGRIGRVFQGQKGLREEIAKVVFSLKVNEISEPFNVKMGPSDQWVVLKVLDRLPRGTMSFDSVKARIREQLLMKKGDPKLQAMIKQARANAKIVVVASKYKKLEKQLKK